MIEIASFTQRGLNRLCANPAYLALLPVDEAVVHGSPFTGSGARFRTYELTTRER
jgi:hypothetical protein